MMMEATNEKMVRRNMATFRQGRCARMVFNNFWLDSINSIFSSRVSMMGKVIKFPNVRERVGKKYRQEEIARINEMMRLCDDDMKTILEQIETLQDELSNLTVEYEVMLNRLKELIEVDRDD